MLYPKELFSAREDVTRENRRRYEQEQRRRDDLIWEECCRIDPDYIHRSGRERYAIREEAKKNIGA